MILFCQKYFGMEESRLGRTKKSDHARSREQALFAKHFAIDECLLEKRGLIYHRRDKEFFIKCA